MKLCSCENLDQMGIARLSEIVSDVNVNINCINCRGLTPLLLVCFFNRSEHLFDCIQILLQRTEINVNSRNKDDWNALSVVCLFNGNNIKLPDIIHLFLQKEIELNPTNSYGWDALSRAVISLSFYHCNHPEFVSIVQHILEYGIFALNTNTEDKNNRLCTLREKMVFLDLGFTNIETMVDLLEEYRIIVAINYPIYSL